MKKTLSLVMCIVMLVSVFSVLTVTASAASPSDSMRIASTSFEKNIVTYTVYLKKNVTVNGAILRIDYDPNVLTPVCENEGAYMKLNSYGEPTQAVPGMFVGNKSIDGSNMFSIGYVSMQPYTTGSTEQGFMQIKFKAIHADRPQTEVKFYCMEFFSNDPALNIPKRETLPAGMYTHTTSTLSRMVLKPVTATPTGLRVNWEKQTGAASYRVFKLVNGSYALIATVGASSTYYDDNTVKSGEKATYTVRAVDKNGVVDSGFPGTISASFVGAPSKVATSIQPTGMKVGWTLATGATSYKIYRREAGTSTWTSVATAGAKATTYIDTAAPSGKKLEYGVKACTANGESATKVSSAMWYYKAPVFTVAGATNGVSITWTGVSGASKYNVYRKYNGASAWTCIATVGSGTTSCVDTAAISGRNIDYTVKTIGANGNSSFASKRIAYVGVPHLTSIANATNGITVKWTTVANATGYRIYRRASGEKSWTYLANTTNAYYTDTTVKSGVYYKYTVRTVFYSVFSNFEDGLLLKCVATPKLTSIGNTSTGITVKWNTVSGANGYRVYRRGAGSNSWLYLGTVSGGSFTDTNVVKGQYYRYTVRAASGNVYSGFDTNGLVTKRS